MMVIQIASMNNDSNYIHWKESCDRTLVNINWKTTSQSAARGVAGSYKGEVDRYKASRGSPGSQSGC